MKRIKRTLAFFAALAALLVAPASAVSDSGGTYVLDCDDYFLVPYHFNSVGGGYILDEQSYFRIRLQAFSRTYDCDICIGCVSSPDKMSFDSFDAYREDFLSRYPGALGDNAVCVLYDQESGASQVHIGSAVAADCDTAPVTEALLDPDAENNYWRMVHVLDALQSAIHRRGTYLFLASSEYWTGIQKNAAPLQEKFTGPLLVFCWNDTGGATIEDMSAAMYEMYRMGEFYTDSIVIFYSFATGEADIWLGEDTGLYADDLDAVKAAFRSGNNDRDYSGFSAGILALADSLHSGQTLPAYVAPLLLGMAAAVLALAAAIEAIAHRRGRPLTPERAER